MLDLWKCKRWLQVGLGCIQLSPSCPFRRLHTFRFLRPARLRTPLLGYGSPHLSARGTSTLLNNALLIARFRFTDDSGASHLDANRNAACGHCGGYSLIGSCHAAVRDPYGCPHKPQTQRAREKQMPSPFTCRQRCQRGMQSVIRP